MPYNFSGKNILSEVLDFYLLYVHATTCINFHENAFLMDAEEKASLYEKLITCTKPEFTDIDSDHKDTQLCSHYAPDIYNNLRIAEVCAQVLFSNFMVLGSSLPFPIDTV